MKRSTLKLLNVRHMTLAPASSRIVTDDGQLVDGLLPRQMLSPSRWLVRCYFGGLMTRRFGDRARLAVEVGEVWPPPPALATGDLRTVDLWAGGTWLTTFDNTAYVPSFTHYIRIDAEQVRRRDIRPCPFPGHSPEEVCRLLYAELVGESDFPWQFRLMDWGPTTDDVTCFAYLNGDELVLTLVRREDNPSPEDQAKVVVAKILADEFVAVLTEASDLLDAERVR